jgi:hypothetical protein
VTEERPIDTPQFWAWWCGRLDAVLRFADLAATETMSPAGEDNAVLPTGVVTMIRATLDAFDEARANAQR